MGEQNSQEMNHIKVHDEVKKGTPPNRMTMSERRLKYNAKRSAVNSGTTSQRPRIQRNSGNSFVVCPRRRQRKAGKPAVNMKTGARICVNPTREEKGNGRTAQCVDRRHAEFGL